MYQKIRRPENTDEKANEDYEINLTRLFSAIELAITQSPLTNMQKLTFVKRKLELMQEFGNIRQYRIGKIPDKVVFSNLEMALLSMLKLETLCI